MDQGDLSVPWPHPHGIETSLALGATACSTRSRWNRRMSSPPVSMVSIGTRPS
jgi:hypothetical protein